MALLGSSSVAKLEAKRNVKGLVRALQHDDASVRSAAATALGNVGDARALDPLVVALRDRDGRVRESSTAALGALGDPTAVEPLTAALQDPAKSVRASAAGALGRLADARAVEPLIAALDDSSGRVQRCAASALGALGDRRAVAPLLLAFKSRAMDVRCRAAEALGAIGDARAVEPLIAALDDTKEASVWAAAAEALGALGDPRAVDPLIVALRDSAADQRSDPLHRAGVETRRTAATAALKRIGAAGAEPLFAALGDSAVQSVAAEVLRNIGWQPREAREAALLAIAEHDWAAAVAGGDAALEPLVHALESGRAPVQAAAALGDLGDSRGVTPLISALERVEHARSEIARALARIGSTALEPLMAALEDPRWQVRAGAAEALGALGDPRAVEPLVAALDDERFEVQQRAAEALEHFESLPEAAARALAAFEPREVKALMDSLRRLLLEHREEMDDWMSSHDYAPGDIGPFGKEFTRLGERQRAERDRQVRALRMRVTALGERAPKIREEANALLAPWE